MNIKLTKNDIFDIIQGLELGLYERPRDERQEISNLLFKFEELSRVPLKKILDPEKIRVIVTKECPRCGIMIPV